MTVVDPLYSRAITTPQQQFLMTPTESWTYLKIERTVNQMIAYCSTLGITAGTKVAIFAYNHPYYLLWVLALTRVGAIIIFCHARLSLTAVIRQLKTIGIPFLITDNEATIDDITTIPLVPSLNQSQTMPPVLELDREHSIFFSSGTTGEPKAICLTLANHYYSAVGVLSRLQVAKSDGAWLLCLPLFHVGALAILWRCLWGGLAIYLHDRFDPSQVIQTVQNHRIGWVSLVPTMLVRILDHPLFLESLLVWQKMRGILVGGAPLSPCLQDRCLALQLPIVTTYGLTEAASTVTTLTATEWRAHPHSAGTVIPGLAMSIEAGQIKIRGRSVFLRYLHQQARDDWFNTKDVGYIDGDGYLVVCDRSDNLIICGGENIYPAEIENLLSRHPHIQDVCVVGKADREWGQIPVAIVQSKYDLSLPDIREFCLAHHLAPYKIPKQLLNWSALPKTATGKTDRAAICKLIACHPDRE
ncbi:MAG: o-succinylbenzoate--CoA ligase [Pseudanabaenaceae cyanobacterium SKYGB_i_bin29]|nr:o-succinylbenzoate--CoA ligase [Pseudanabaenaceae cyanobacterium SKYG29]MDW8422087.1 o-succinylbenzoate--CoA ligase [Pseudanabaenaceae cyanobacterium SKYGB_i_bin29]